MFITVGQSTVARQQHKHHFSEIKANNCFQFWLSGPSICAIVDFVVLENFNSNNLLCEAAVGLKQFYPKSFRKQFCAFLKAASLLGVHKTYAINLKRVLVFVCFQSWWSLVRERNIKVIYETISEAVVGFNQFYPKSFQKQFCAFLKGPEF